MTNRCFRWLAGFPKARILLHEPAAIFRAPPWTGLRFQQVTHSVAECPKTHPTGIEETQYRHLYSRIEIDAEPLCRWGAGRQILIARRHLQKVEGFLRNRRRRNPRMSLRVWNWVCPQANCAIDSDTNCLTSFRARGSPPQVPYPARPFFQTSVEKTGCNDRPAHV